MKNQNAAVVAGTVICAILSLPARATFQQPSPGLPDEQKLGPQIGSPMPDFTLSDQTGTPRTLRLLMGPKGLMLVFSRSVTLRPLDRERAKT